MSRHERYFLILSASGGVGHTRAAEALKQAADSSNLPIKAKHVDCLDLTSKTFKKLYADSYLAMANKAPELWGYFYNKSESKPYEKKGLIRIFDELNYKRYLEFLVEESPDALICTHFLPYISLSTKLRKAGFKAPIFAVTTDFDAHQYWVDPVVNRYYVYADESAWQLRSKGVSADKIFVKGIPVLPQFQHRIGSPAARNALGLERDRFTILMVWGGFGVGKAEQMVNEVTAMLQIFPDRLFTLLLVCGRNDKLRQRISKSTSPKHIDVRVYGFVENLHEMMCATDILVSKAGGLTSAEAMSLGIPMIIVDPIPGQETRNAEIIVEQGAGWKALNIANLGYKVKRIIETPELLSAARQATTRLAQPTAAQDILADVHDYVQEAT